MIHEGDADIAEELKGDVEGYLCQLKPFRRPGATSFFGLLEYKYFKEKRDKKEVKVLYSRWAGCLFYILVVPTHRRAWVDEVLKQVGLQAEEKYPHIWDEETGKAHPFPVRPKNLLTLTNVIGHFVYENDQEKLNLAYKAEDEASKIRQAEMYTL